MVYSSDKLVKKALSYVGYLEKKSNDNLDDFTANAGAGNYTKFCRDYERYMKADGFQPSYWCAEYVSCVVVETFGLSAAKELLCGDLFASCTIGRDQFRKRGQFHTENPLPGDIVMFYNSKRTGLAHCGFVTSVENNNLHTSEGNTSAGKNVVIDNGGAVANKVYRLNNPRIAGYCRMALDGLDPTLPSVKNRSVALFQGWLNGIGSFGLVVDGVHGKLTRKAAIKCLQMHLNERYHAYLDVDGEFGPLTKKSIPMLKIGDSGVLVQLLQGMLACQGYAPGELDGLFGLKTEQALFAFQKKKLHLSPTKSKICTANTWEKLFK